MSYPMCHTPRASINSRMGYVNTKIFGFFICEYKIKIHFYFFVYHYVYKTYMFFKIFAITPTFRQTRAKCQFPPLTGTWFHSRHV